MKKVKLTTVTLALLAGSVVAPIISTATELNNEGVKTTETVTSAPEKEAETPAPEKETPAPEKEAETPAPKNDASKPASTPKADNRASQVDPNTELNDAIQTARNEAYARHIAGDISYDEFVNLDTRISACKSVADVNEMITYMNSLNKELKTAKEKAIREVDDLFATYKISLTSRDAYMKRIDAAGTLAVIDAVLVEARSEAALFDAKLAAKTEVQSLVDGYGFTNDDALAFQMEIESAKTIGEINAIVAKAHAAAELGTMRDNAKAELNILLQEGTITTDEYYIYANQIDVATTQSEMDSILAAAKEFVDLKEYKNEAKFIVSEFVYDGKLLQSDYYKFADQIDDATNKAEVDQALANARASVALNEAKNAAEDTVLELAQAYRITSDDYWTAMTAIRHATTIEEVNAAVAAAQAIAEVSDARIAAIDEIQALVDGRGFTDADALVFIEQLYSAETVGQINTVVEAAKAFAELNGAKVLAYDEIFALLLEGKLTEAEYYEFTALVDAATDQAGIDSAVAAAHARVELNEVKELAKETILKLAHAELIDSGEYWDFVNAIDAATSIEEVNSIVDEAHTLANFRQAKLDAKDELFSMLTTGDISMMDYYHFMELVDNADTTEAVNEVMATANALVLARESAAEELDGLHKEDLLTLVETDGFKHQMENVRTAEEVEAIMAEARTLAESRRVVEITESTITVKYVDVNGNEIKESESLTKEVGNTHLFVAPVVDGYVLEGPASLELTYSDSPQTVTFTYKALEEVVATESTITVNYVDENGKELKASDKLTEKVGTKHTFEAAKIEGYEINGPSSLALTFADSPQSVTFTYKKLGKVTTGKEKPGKVTPTKNNKTTDNKKADNKTTENKKDSLPQTGEAAANAGLVAGGIVSMLTAAFVFLRKGK